MVLRKTWVLSRYRSVFYESQGLEVSLSADLCVSKSHFFADVSQSLGFVVFVCPFSRIFSELIGI